MLAQIAKTANHQIPPKLKTKVISLKMFVRAYSLIMNSVKVISGFINPRILMSELDNNLKEYILSAKRNATYLSKTTQNDLVSKSIFNRK